MSWIKDSYLDIIVLILIGFYSFFPGEVIEIVLWVYTALLLLGKILALFMPSLQKRAGKTETPAYIYHIIYGLSVLLLLFVKDFYLAGAWMVVWALSAYSFYK